MKYLGKYKDISKCLGIGGYYFLYNSNALDSNDPNEKIGKYIGIGKCLNIKKLSWGNISKMRHTYQELYGIHVGKHNDRHYIDEWDHGEYGFYDNDDIWELSEREVAIILMWEDN